MNFLSFHQGENYKAYIYLGAHNYSDVTSFRVFAPNAESVDVIGDFNGWSPSPCHRVFDGCFWECDIFGAYEGMRYLFRIHANGEVHDHIDPFGYKMELRPAYYSVIKRLGYTFHDWQWLDNRGIGKDKPMNIYEIHAGSWKKPSVRFDDWYNLTELADKLIPYLTHMGYNYVELMPLSEHPCDESWGYQQTGFFSVTSRYGDATDLACFVDKCHMAGIGVLLDFVAVHFAVDDYSLYKFDGTHLYEYPNGDMGMSQWGSYNFIHSKGEVRSFLQSSAEFWISEFHVDGLRFDAINNLIYWQGDKNRGVNSAATDFLRSLTRNLHERHPDVILIAEDSSDFAHVTTPSDKGGLGFDYKWDMGWMNDTLSYFQSPEHERENKPHALPFSMDYFPSESFLLPFSHDEVVHGKASILQKMDGNEEKKFPAARALYMYMFAHPGKKLNFMGNELGQIREWSEKRELDWDNLSDAKYEQFHRFIYDLNHVYLYHSELWQKDYEDSFQWLLRDAKIKCCYAFLRKSDFGSIAAVFNFSTKQKELEIEIPDAQSLCLILSSDCDYYGGCAERNFSEIPIVNGIAKITMTPLSAKYFSVITSDELQS